MKPTDAAKRGRYEVVVDAVENGDATDLCVLLQKVCQDFRSITKHEGHLKLANYLLSAGAKPRREMVCETARGGHESLVHALAKGGLINDLFVAAALGDIEAVKRHLAESATAVTVSDRDGMSPLHYCCASSIWRDNPERRRQFLEVSSMLLSAEADIHRAGRYHGLAGVTPLFYVAWTGGHSDIAKQLLQRGAEVNSNTFLAAVWHFQRHGDGNYDVAKTLLQHGHDVNHCDDRTALHAFASHEDLRGVTWLLENGANVDARDSNGNTPLMVAARRNSGVKVLHCLVQAGCLRTAQNVHGETALDLAQRHGKAKAVVYLGALGK